MAINIGFSACVLRSVLQSVQKLIAWFARIRGPRYGPNRTVFGSQQIDSSFPDQDIRDVVFMADDRAADLLLLNTIAKLEQSPGILIDGGASGLEPKIVGPIGQLAAGSMGLVIPVNLDHHQAVEGLFKIAAQIYDQFPAHLRSSLLPSPPTEGRPLDPRSWPVNHMAKELIMVAPLISGSWPPAFGASTRPELQELEAYGGFSSLRLRELTESYLADD